MGYAGRRLHRPGLGGTAGRNAPPRAVPRPRRKLEQPLCAGHRPQRARRRVALRGAPLPWMFRRIEPPAAGLPFGRFGGNRLDPAAHQGWPPVRRNLCCGRLAGWQRAAQVAGGACGGCGAGCCACRVRLRADRPGRRRTRPGQRFQHDLYAHVPRHPQAQGRGQARTVSRQLRRQGHACLEDPLRLRQRRDRPAARISRYERLLEPCQQLAVPRGRTRANAGAQCAKRSLPSRKSAGEY